MNPHCQLCDGENGEHGMWLGRICPMARVALEKQVQMAAAQTGFAQRYRETKEVAELERLWRLR